MQEDHRYVLISSFLLLILLCGCRAEDDRIKEMVKEKDTVLRSLVHIGMNVDEAIEVLRKNGYRVGEKHMPTKKGDYYAVAIPLIDKIPMSSIFAEVTGTDSKLRTYAIIKADLNNIITSIE